MDQIKEALEKHLREVLTRASDYLDVVVRANEEGIPVKETVHMNNYSYLLGVCKGVQEALKVLEDIDYEGDEKHDRNGIRVNTT